MSKEKICGIYCIENLINHKKYIGQSVNITNRFYGHKNKLKENIHRNDHLQAAWNKYGEDNFEFSIIELCDESLLDEKEKYYIKFYDSNTNDNGYNIELGGKGKGQIPDSIKKKISENHADVSGKNNPFYGKHHSKETICKMLNNESYQNRKVKGEDSYRAILTEKEVIEIKKYFKENILKYGDMKVLADKYNVKISLLSHIKNNYTWQQIVV